MINQNVYIIDFDKLVKWCYALVLRKPNNLTFVQALLNPLKELYQSFINFKDESIYRASHNSQVCYMQKVLNDNFDNLERRIVIKNTIVLEPNWLYHPDDNKPKFIYHESDNRPRYIYSIDDFNNDDVDFNVIVPIEIKPLTPQEVVTFEVKMRAEIDYYKLYSKNYKIIYG